MPYYAKLIKGQTYDVLDQRFSVDKEIEVDEKTYGYLQNNEQFELSEREWKDGKKEEDEVPPPQNGERYEEAELKKLNKKQQDILIHQLSGDTVNEAKNEGERIALIMQLQEEEGE